jgi:hypothetical protein
MEIIHETKNATPLVNGSAATYGTAGNVNASVEIAGFDFSGTGHRKISVSMKFQKIAGEKVGSIVWCRGCTHLNYLKLAQPLLPVS